MIDKEFKQNISDYSIAAAYYSQRNTNLEMAKRLQELVIDLKEKPSAWTYHEYGITLQKMGEINNAINAIEYSLKLSNESNIEYLIKENNTILKNLKGK